MGDALSELGARDFKEDHMWEWAAINNDDDDDDDDWSNRVETGWGVLGLPRKVYKWELSRWSTNQYIIGLPPGNI
jgi:hypothetical protein